MINMPVAWSLVTATAVAVTFWMACPGADAVTDRMLMIACEDMRPRHPGFIAENYKHDPCPYVLNVDTIPIVPGEMVNVTLTSVNGTTPFKGFMVQARDDDDRVIGTFIPSCEDVRSYHMIGCRNGNENFNTAVQSNNKIKYRETFTWVAPVTLKGTFRFKYTVVLDFEHFWIREVTNYLPVVHLSKEEYDRKMSINPEHYVHKLYYKHFIGKRQQ